MGERAKDRSGRGSAYIIEYNILIKTGCSNCCTLYIFTPYDANTLKRTLARYYKWQK